MDDSASAVSLPVHQRVLYALGPALPLLACCVLAYLAWARFAGGTPSSVWVWFMPALLFVAVPLLDWGIGVDRRNQPDATDSKPRADARSEGLLVVVAPLQWLCTILGCWLVATWQPAAMEFLGLVLTVGAVNGLGIVAAHELGHRMVPWKRWCAVIGLAPSGYGHFIVEHNRGHHKHVATPLDPASARLGESFWRFLPRTLFGGLRSAWRLEADRLQHHGQPVLSWRNQNLQAWAVTAVLFAALTLWLGPLVLVFLLLQALYAASQLEVVNYVEHYGLLRRQEADGRYERCAPEHSWNSDHIVTNFFLFQLQRHSDHHAHPARPYTALRHFDISPQLPSGYASMMLLAYCPPLWFAVMDPRVLRHYKLDLRRAHVHAPARAGLLARYPLPV